MDHWLTEGERGDCYSCRIPHREVQGPHSSIQQRQDNLAIPQRDSHAARDKASTGHRHWGTLCAQGACKLAADDQVSLTQVSLQQRMSIPEAQPQLR